MFHQVKHPIHRMQGLLRRSRGGTYPSRLAWGTSCPVHELLPSACQDVHGRIYVPIQDHTTVGTHMDPHVQVLLDDPAAARTCLARLMGIDFDECPASSCRLASAHRHEHAPSSI